MGAIYGKCIRTDISDKVFVNDGIRIITGGNLETCPRCNSYPRLKADNGVNDYYCPACGCMFHACEKVKFERNGAIYCRFCRAREGIIRGDSVIYVIKCPQCGAESFRILSGENAPFMCNDPNCKYIWNQSIYLSVEETIAS